MKRLILFLFSHGVAVAIGFAAGIYFLPILTAPPAPDAALLEERAQEAMFNAELTRELRGSDRLHWGEGMISLTETQIVHQGALSPGPDYKLYLVPEFVEHEDEFEPIKETALRIGDVKTFDGFILDVPADVDLEAYNTVLIWCEAFSEFITAAQYR
ncbi:MAG: DM13 domain-containing protein [Dinoroseobacter sp.]|nr:DM13 domain-containing protein [Dinoroseobacter sp.]MDJ0995235.1 DM13 domain-containing protein [Dinoroseobacter sp.]